MRAAALRAVTVLVITQGAGSVGAAQAPAPALLTLDAWMSAVYSHEPGVHDVAIDAMRSIRTPDLEAAFAPMVAVLDAAVTPPARLKWDTVFRDHAGRKFPAAQAARMAPLAHRIKAFGIGRFLKRAAVLHSDLGVIAPNAHLTFSYGGSHFVQDGVSVADAGRTWHWMLARAFLHAVPGAADDPAVGLWYQAVATHLWSSRSLVEAGPHITAGLAIFPRDADLHFARGLMHESRGAPHIQAGVEAQIAGLPKSERLRFDRVIQSAVTEQRNAKWAFAEALELDPNHVEARIRYGRSLVLAGEHRQAAVELRNALEREPQPMLRYFAYLFLARAYEGLGRIADARGAYASASALFPAAQSPRLSLSQIALQAGDPDAARRGLALLSEPAAPDADPWWAYHYERQPHLDVLMARARAALGAAK
jgi:hypothetical protein